MEKNTGKCGNNKGGCAYACEEKKPPGAEGANTSRHGIHELLIERIIHSTNSGAPDWLVS